jgi:hypothetical protein
MPVAVLTRPQQAIWGRAPWPSHRGTGPGTWSAPTAAPLPGAVAPSMNRWRLMRPTVNAWYSSWKGDEMPMATSLLSFVGRRIQPTAQPVWWECTCVDTIAHGHKRSIWGVAPLAVTCRRSRAAGSAVRTNLPSSARSSRPMTFRLLTLTDPAWSGQRQQAGPRTGKEVAKPREVLLAVDQPGWLRREMVWEWQFASATEDGLGTAWPRDRAGSLHARPPFRSASFGLYVSGSCVAEARKPVKVSAAAREEFLNKYPCPSSRLLKIPSFGRLRRFADCGRDNPRRRLGRASPSLRTTAFRWPLRPTRARGSLPPRPVARSTRGA